MVQWQYRGKDMEKERKFRKVVKKIMIAIAIIVAIIVGVIIIVAIKQLQQEETLKTEIINYSNKDLATDNFQIEIKTKGDCAHIEEAIKKYYKELSDNVKEINSHLNKDEFTKILSPENLSKDHPDFTLSHATLKNVKTKMQKLLGNIEKLCDEETLKELIDKEKLSDPDYYYDLYKELMYTKKDLKELTDVKSKMKELSLTLTEFLDKVDEMLIYLQKNDSFVEYQNSGVIFKSEETLTGYKKLIAELQSIASKFTNLGSSKEEKGTEI